MREKRNAYNISFRNPEGNRLLGRLKCKCEDNIQMDVKETGNKNVNWTHLNQNRI
jgi:hypothetical protein